MSLWLDQSYLKQISYRLEGFKEKRIGTLYNFRCPLCGDSRKKANKMRGYFYSKGNQLLFMCHNCGVSESFGKFLKTFDPNLYNVYALEKFKESAGAVKAPRKTKSDKVIEAMKSIPKTQKYIPNVCESLLSIDQLASSHPARQYVEGRGIPEQFHVQLYYAPKFYEWASGHTDKFKYTVGSRDHPRLIIPWFTENSGTLFAYSARSFGKEEPKYYNIILDDSHPKFYGMERLDRSKTIRVCEGPLDSLFIPNCIAVGNSAIGKFTSDGDVVYIPDKDCRNKEIMEITKNLIKSGKKVCMLPDLIGDNSFKDINEMVLKNNLSQNELLDIIQQNTYQGLAAELHFTKWNNTLTKEKVHEQEIYL
jgi:hypothetical protein